MRVLARGRTAQSVPHQSTHMGTTRVVSVLTLSPELVPPSVMEYVFFSGALVTVCRRPLIPMSGEMYAISRTHLFGRVEPSVIPLSVRLCKLSLAKWRLVWGLHDIPRPHCHSAFRLIVTCGLGYLAFCTDLGSSLPPNPIQGIGLVPRMYLNRLSSIQSTTLRVADWFIG